MNVSYIYISIAALLCFAMMFAAFFAAKRSRIKNYRDSVSKTPNIDSVLRQTVEVIKTVSMLTGCVSACCKTADMFPCAARCRKSPPPSL